MHSVQNFVGGFIFNFTFTFLGGVVPAFVAIPYKTKYMVSLSSCVENLQLAIITFRKTDRSHVTCYDNNRCLVPSI